ncbi:MAG: HAD-IA family hydrolase [Bacteroidia bacterium]|nr:HAD-IA family hydrolase [Bacteroidia bacterium]
MSQSTFQSAIQRYLNSNNHRVFDLKAVMFDMDGVLFDSMPIHAVAWTQALVEMGVEFTEEEAYLHEGRTGNGTIGIVYQRSLGRDATEDEKQKIYKRKSDLFEASAEAPVMPGAVELLEKVKADHLMRILVTGSGQKTLLTKLNLHFPHQFTRNIMVTAFDVTIGKPHPEPYLQGLVKSGFEAFNAIVVENAPLGVESAKAAGLFTIAVNTGKLQDYHLLDAGADLIFDSMNDLNEAWHELFKDFRVTLSAHPVF